jgi:hypothetical protein
MVTTVTRSSRSSVASGGPGSRSSRSPRTSVPPLSSAITISHTDMSNDSEASCSTRSPGPTPNISRSIAATGPTPRCGTTTPLGRPVEPEV